MQRADPRLALIAALLSVGCQREAIEDRLSGSTSVHGQVFVTVREGSSVKLGGVEIRALPAEETLESIEVAKADYEQKRAALVQRLSSQAEAAADARFAAAQGRVEVVQNELAKVTKEIEHLEATLRRAAAGEVAQTENPQSAPSSATVYIGQRAVAVYVGDDVATGLVPLLGQAHLKSRSVSGRERELWTHSGVVFVAEDGKIVSFAEDPSKVAGRIGQQLIALRSKKTSLQESLRQAQSVGRDVQATVPPDLGLSAQAVFRHFPAAMATTVTDADGRFTIDVPTRLRFALAAHATRELFDSSEEHYWLVWADEEVAKKELYLTNRNLMTSGGIESVLQVSRPTSENGSRAD